MINRMQKWYDVKKLWLDWQYYEAADRGYDAKAATAAQDKFNKARLFYELWFGTTWKD